MAKSNKTKKISISTFEKVMKETAEAPTTVLNWHDVELVVKHRLSLKEMLEFVNEVTGLCFTLDTSVYIPEVKEFAIKSCVLSMYANFSLPEDMQKRYELVYNTDAYSTVELHIDMAQFEEITDAIDEKLRVMTQENIEMVRQQIREAYIAIEDMKEQIETVFSMVSAEDMTKFIGAVAKSGFNRDELVQAYLNQSSEELEG